MNRNEIINEKVNKIFSEIVDIRRTLHMNPELSEHETETASFIASKLSAMGISYADNIAGNGIVGIIPGKDPTKAIAIRADIDALPIEEATDEPFRSKIPGVMHACGHDIHTAILLGTATILNDMKEELPYSVKLFFQPSEETIGGANQMIQAGCMSKPEVSKVLGLHVESSVPAGSIEFIPGAMNAASTEFYVKVIGESCHGAHPDKGIDPIIASCSMVTALQTIISRNMNPAEPALITVGQFHSGTKNNIIPPECNFSGIIRALTLESREFLKNKITQIIDNQSEAFGTKVETTFRDSYPSLENDDDMLLVVKKAAEEILGKDKVQTKMMPSLGADDFSYFCHGSKGLYFNIGTKKTGDDNPFPIHSDHFDPDEECIRTGMLVEIASAFKLLEDM